VIIGAQPADQHIRQHRTDLARRLPKHLSNLLRRCVSRCEEYRQQRIGVCCCSEASAIMAPALCEVLPRRIETRVRQVQHVALFCRCRGPVMLLSLSRL